MKIALDCRMINSGGIGTYFESLLPYFLKNYECLLIGKSSIINKYKNNNVILCPCNVKTFSIKELFAFPKNILSQINKCSFYYSPYCNIPSGIKIPIYSTIHDVVFLDVKGLTSKIGVFVRKWFYQHAINRSKTIFTVSQFSKDRIFQNLKVKKSPIIVTYNSVPQWFIDNKIKSQKEDYILFVGNIKQHKGLHVLLSAFEKLQQNKINTKLIIVGNSENFRTGDNTILDKINSFTNGTIEFTGKISNDELKQYYAKARLLIQPSFYEGFGMPPLEALNCGTNVLLSDIPVFKEIYNDYPVYFFKTGDSEDLAKKIIENYTKEAPLSLPNKYSFENTFKIIQNSIN